jgi:hypothetical protein
MTTPPAGNPTKEANSSAHNQTPNADHSQLRTDNKLASRLQDAIDERGRYSYKLKEYALGYAAGAGINEDEAKEKIKAVFEERIGVSIQDYLEQHRHENGLSVDRGEDNGR